MEATDTLELMQAVTRGVTIVSVEEAQNVLDEINHMDTVMPITDPTKYRDILQNIRDYRDFVEAFIQFRIKLDKLKGLKQL